MSNTFVFPRICRIYCVVNDKINILYIKHCRRLRHDVDESIHFEIGCLFESRKDVEMDTDGFKNVEKF